MANYSDRINFFDCHIFENKRKIIQVEIDPSSEKSFSNSSVYGNESSFTSSPDA
jgi:hypothetical protein